MSERLKEIAGKKAVEQVRDGMVVGLGSGSTAEYAIRALGERCAAEGMDIRCVPTSEASGHLGGEVGLQVTSLEEEPAIDLTIDGADEVDPDLNLVKGLGGALLREKIVAAASAREIIIVDPSKLVDRLGTRSPLPVEVLPFAWALSRSRLMEVRQLRGAAHAAPVRAGSTSQTTATSFSTAASTDGIQDAADFRAEDQPDPGSGGERPLRRPHRSGHRRPEEWNLPGVEGLNFPSHAAQTCHETKKAPGPLSNRFSFQRTGPGPEAFPQAASVDNPHASTAPPPFHPDTGTGGPPASPPGFGPVRIVQWLRRGENSSLTLNPNPVAIDEFSAVLAGGEQDSTAGNSGDYQAAQCPAFGPSLELQRQATENDGEEQNECSRSPSPRGAAPAR